MAGCVRLIGTVLLSGVLAACGGGGSGGGSSGGGGTAGGGGGGGSSPKWLFSDDTESTANADRSRLASTDAHYKKRLTGVDRNYDNNPISQAFVVYDENGVEKARWDSPGNVLCDQGNSHSGNTLNIQLLDHDVVDGRMLIKCRVNVYTGGQRYSLRVFDNAKTLLWNDPYPSEHPNGSIIGKWLCSPRAYGENNRSCRNIETGAIVEPKNGPFDYISLNYQNYIRVGDQVWFFGHNTFDRRPLHIYDYDTFALRASVDPHWWLGNFALSNYAVSVSAEYMEVYNVGNQVILKFFGGEFATDRYRYYSTLVFPEYDQAPETLLELQATYRGMSDEYMARYDCVNYGTSCE